MKEWLTIAIPTMDRFSFLRETLPTYLQRPEVARVILCDETGDDEKALQSTPFYTHPKLRVIVNNKRLGIYQNKLKCIRESQDTPMVAVLDSDNIFSDEWFEVLSEAVKRHGFDTIYGSAEFQSVNRSTGESIIPCAAFVNHWIRSPSDWNSLFQKTKWNHLLNDGNWVLPSKAALAALPADIKSSDLEAVDALFMLKEFVRSGIPVWYVPTLSYIHIVHPGSSWLNTAAKSNRILNNTVWTL